MGITGMDVLRSIPWCVWEGGGGGWCGGSLAWYKFPSTPRAHASFSCVWGGRGVGGGVEGHWRGINSRKLERMLHRVCVWRCHWRGINSRKLLERMLHFHVCGVGGGWGVVWRVTGVV